MSELVRKNWFLLLISLLISIVIWIYVSYVVNPGYVKEIKDIPIVFNNLSSDFESGKLKIIEANCQSISVQVKGDRNIIASVKKDDIIASVDMISVTKSGSYSLQILVNFGDDGISVLQKNPQRCEIVVDDVVVEEREIGVKITGNLQEGFYINGEPSVNPAKVKITGPKSYVSRISRAEAIVNLEGKDADIRENAPVRLVDVVGDELTFGDKSSRLPGVSIDISEANVHYSVSNKKEVEIYPDLKNKNAMDTSGISWEIISGKKVTVWGPANTVKNVDKILTEPIDISQLSHGQEVELRVIIPDGVESDYDAKKVRVRFSMDGSPD